MRTIEDVIAELRKDIHSDVYLGKKTIGTYLDEILEIHNEEKAGWIPVSERLPEKPTGHEWYWSSYHGKDIAADEYIVMIKDAEFPTSLYWTGDVWMNVYAQTLDDCNITYDVVAWMPLPTPYEPQESEEQA